MAKFPPTPQQEDIFSAINAGESIFVQARAGTGKSSTQEMAVKESCEFSKPQGVLAFNAHIKKAAEAAMGSKATVLTFNGAGHRAWGKYLGTKISVDVDKSWNLSRAAGKRHDCFKYGNIKKLADAAITSRLFPKGIPKPATSNVMEDTEHNWEELSIDALDSGEVATGIEIDCAREVVLNSVETAFAGELSFNEQIVYPLIWKAPFQKFSRMYVDESQDLNPDNHEQIQRMLAHNGQLIAVGDPAQAIYGFRGADMASIENLSKAHDLSMLPLTVSWRCGKAIIEHAQEIVPDIEYAPNAKPGLVEEIKTMAPEPGDLILARTNAPLVSMAFQLIREGHNIRVLGHDIALGLKNLVKTCMAGTVAEVENNLNSWRELQRVKHQERRPAKYERFMDRAATLQAFLDDLPNDSNGEEIPGKIDFLFKRDGRITLSSIHRAKGSEAPRVTIIQRAGAEPWMDGPQEDNLDYVSRTRPMNVLQYYFPEV